MPTVAEPNTVHAYVAMLLSVARGEPVPAIDAQSTATSAGVTVEKFHADLEVAIRRVEARQAIDAANSTACRADELRSRESFLVAAEAEAINAAKEQLRIEFERKYADAIEQAKRPLLAFKLETGVESATLSEISKAAAAGRKTLLNTSDPRIDEAITILQRAESEVWGGVAIERRAGAQINLARCSRRQEREEQIRRLQGMKLEPSNFASAASSAWRAY